jgi:CelD/BcsL family acetyltransferase involved in cellulose biosynthesis
MPLERPAEETTPLGNSPAPAAAGDGADHSAPNHRSPEPGGPSGAGASSDRSLTLTVYGPDAQPNGFAALAGEWNTLLAESTSNTLFLTHEWQSTWWNNLGEGELWILAWRQESTGRLVAIAPFYLITFGEDAASDLAGKRQLNIVGCIEVSDYLDLIVAQGWEDDLYPALIGWLQSGDAPEWDILDLCNLPEYSPTQSALPAVLEQAGLQVRVFQEDVAPQFPLPMRFEEYLATQVDKKQRHEIRRKMRRAEREAVVGFQLYGPGQNLQAEVDDFIALQRASRADKSEFMTPRMHRFFHAAAQTLADAGWLRLCFLTLNGEKAASLFAFEYDGHFMLYNSGYDPDAHAHLSPGWVILAYAIQYAVATGCHRFDFMQGDEAYKYHFGSEDLRVMRVIAGKG